MAGDNCDEAQALAQAKGFAGLKGMDLAKEVTRTQVLRLDEGSWSGVKVIAKNRGCRLPWHVVAYDYGVKRNILRMLVDRGCRLYRGAGPDTCSEDVLAMNPDGMFLSNGPGDPEPCDLRHEAIQELLETEIPSFGICLGHQLLRLASRRNNGENEVRPSRRQSSGAEPRRWHGVDYQPESRLCGRREQLARHACE